METDIAIVIFTSAEGTNLTYGIPILLQISGIRSTGIKSSKFMEKTHKNTVIDNGAFGGCSNLSRVTCYAQIPPSTPMGQYNTSDPWDATARSSATLYVPKGCADVYRNFYNRTYFYGNVYPYAKFKEIIEIDEMAGISSGIYDDSNIEISRFNASGIKVNSATNGLNIIRMSNGTIKKVIK